MGRTLSSIPAEKLVNALAYVQRALDRKSDVFVSGLKETERSLARLRKQMLTMRREDALVEVNDWLTAYVTPAGRRLMLTALRQQVSAKKKPSRSPLTAEVRQDLTRLADAVGAPQSIALRCLLTMALADDSVLARVRALAAVATAESDLR
jgi:hypothetical protein